MRLIVLAKLQCSVSLIGYGKHSYLGIMIFLEYPFFPVEKSMYMSKLLHFFSLLFAFCYRVYFIQTKFCSCH